MGWLSTDNGGALVKPSSYRMLQYVVPDRHTIALTVVSPALAGCSGVQSTLDAAGEEATQIAVLFWVMLAGGTAIWAGVILVALYAARWKRKSVSEASARKLVVWAGAVLPVIVLTVLLSFTLWLMPALRPFSKQGTPTLRIEVTGHQFWWQVVYRLSNGARIESANELRVPAGAAVEFTLRSADMIHSFWIPALAGKMDMIPGRINQLSLHATRVGTYRGQCAEFCGTSHAHMALSAVVMEPIAFNEWISNRSKPSPGLDLGGSGVQVFRKWRCGECHRINGTDAAGTAGPDLSHVGSRLTIGAGLSDNTPDNIARFIEGAAFLKPGIRMPAYPGMPEVDRAELASWLKALQ